MTMKPRTKDRWLTAGTVVVLLALGCTSPEPEPEEVWHSPQQHRIDQPMFPCDTDSDCQEKHGGDGGPAPKIQWSEGEYLKRPL